MMGADWFVEEQAPGLCFGVRVSSKLLSLRTSFQQLDLLETTSFGRLLALDGRVMLTERDEMFYHEMLVHPAMLAHPEPLRVAVIGGGDGGAVREVLRHPSVLHVDWVELDEMVIAVAREHLPSVCQGVFDDSRVTLLTMPGEEWASQCSRDFDLIIVDGTDPIGPAVPLFDRSFFACCQRGLRVGGLFATQTGSPFYYPDELRSVHGRLREAFGSVEVRLGFVPTYPAVWSYCLAGAGPLNLAASEVERRFAARKLNLSYLTPSLHLASAVLPGFVASLLTAAADSTRGEDDG